MSKEKRVTCDWCKENTAPLKLTNMLVGNDYEVKVVCSQCVMKTPHKELFGEDGPKTWPARFYRNGNRKPNSIGLYQILILLLLLGLVVSVSFIHIGGR